MYFSTAPFPNPINNIIKCNLSFGAESFVFQVAIQKFKDQDIQNYNFACCFVWVWNLVVDTAGGKEAEGIWEYLDLGGTR